MTKRFLVLCVVTVAAVSCGASGPPDTQSEELAALAQSGWTPPSGINLVPHTRLAAFVPTLPGWPVPETRGETDTTELVTRVYANYDRGEDQLQLELIDAVMNPLVMAPLTELMASDEAAVAAGYQRTTIGNFPGVEEWLPEARNGTVTIVVADRYTVKFTGSYVTSLNVIRDAVAKVELQKLAGLK